MIKKKIENITCSAESLASVVFHDTMAVTLASEGF
jgi:hypothetical protein